MGFISPVCSLALCFSIVLFLSLFQSSMRLKKCLEALKGKESLIEPWAPKPQIKLKAVTFCLLARALSWSLTVAFNIIVTLDNLHELRMHRILQNHRPSDRQNALSSGPRCSSYSYPNKKVTILGDGKIQSKFLHYWSRDKSQNEANKATITPQSLE